MNYYAYDGEYWPTAQAKATVNVPGMPQAKDGDSDVGTCAHVDTTPGDVTLGGWHGVECETGVNVTVPPEAFTLVGTMYSDGDTAWVEDEASGSLYEVTGAVGMDMATGELSGLTPATSLPSAANAVRSITLEFNVVACLSLKSAVQ